MVSLVDIGDLTETVPIRGKKLSVSGISAKGLLVLLSRFPEIRKIVASRGQDIDPEKLIQLAPDAVACIIAAGCGAPGDEAAEEKVAGFGVGEQLDLLTGIWKLTFPTGIAPFVEKLTALVGPGNSVGDALGWDPATKSQGRSNSASPPDTRQH